MAFVVEVPYFGFGGNAGGPPGVFTTLAHKLKSDQVNSATLLDYDNRVLFKSARGSYWASLPTNTVLDRLVEALVEKDTLREPELVPFIAPVSKGPSAVVD